MSKNTQTIAQRFDTMFKTLGKIVAPHKFGSAVLEDGTNIEWDGELAEGVAIMVVVEGEDPIPAPDGSHVTSEGITVVTVGGLVTEIIPVADEGSADEGAEFSDDEIFSQKVTAIVEPLIAKMGQKFAEKSDFNAFKNESLKVVKAVAFEVQQIAERPQTVVLQKPEEKEVVDSLKPHQKALLRKK